jgi:hypothetical protein
LTSDHELSPKNSFLQFLGLYNINIAIEQTSEVAVTTILSLNHVGCDYVQLAPGADHGSVGPEAYTIFGTRFLRKRIQNYKPQI